MTWITAELQPLLAVVMATLDATGRLIEANRGFLRLIDAELTHENGKSVSQYFIQPNFATLLEMPTAPGGEIYSGLLTFGDYMGQTRTLRARIWREGDQLRILAEFDIEEFERLCTTTLELNRDYAKEQVELAQSNFKLKQSEARLQQLVDELTIANREREQAQHQVLQSEKMASIGQLAAGIAHEINNPVGFVNSNMGSLQNYVGTLLSVIEQDEQAASAHPLLAAQLATVRNQAELDFLKADVIDLVNESMDGLQRIKDIVQALKDFSHVDQTEFETADLHHGLESTLKVVHNELKYKATIEKQYGDVPRIDCLASQLNQVFMNLLVNAGHAIKEHGVISIRTGAEADWVWVEISDTGSGIPPESLPHIFDPFFTTKPVGKGTGLGLSLSYGIVKKHGGKIEVASEVGKGSRFTIWLPVQPA